MALQLPIHRDHPPELVSAASLTGAGSEERRGTLRVGDLAKATGKTVRALHLYEEMGLLEPAHRSKGGYRLYGSEALVRVRWIGKLQEMGFSLSEIQLVVKDYSGSGSAPDAMRRVKALYHQKLAETRRQLETLATLEGELRASLDYLETCDTSCDASRVVRACPSCDLHSCDHPAPELVAGLHSHTQ